MNHIQPDIGSWFENIDSGERFEVVAIDDAHQMVEVQYQDGTLDEFGLGQWQALPLVTAVPLEDANSAYGTAASEQDPDLLSSEMPRPEDLLDRIEGESPGGGDEFF